MNSDYHWAVYYLSICALLALPIRRIDRWCFATAMVPIIAVAMCWASILSVNIPLMISGKDVGPERFNPHYVLMCLEFDEQGPPQAIWIGRDPARNRRVLLQKLDIRHGHIETIKSFHP